MDMQDVVNKVHAATRALNDAVEEAQAAGLQVEIQQAELSVMGLRFSRPVLTSLMSLPMEEDTRNEKGAAA